MRRRELILLLTAAACSPRCLAQAGPGSGELRYLSVRGDRQRRYFVSGIERSGRVRFDLPLPERAHGIALHPSGDEAMVVARRPGRFLQRIDLRRGRLLETLACEEGRHFYGHAVFSPDGRRLYTTENDYEAGRGVIAVRDADDGYRLIDEFPSGGVGPHELRLLSDGRTLAVANGGIRTHPDFDRAPLNLESMRPVLAYLDRLDGRLLEAREPPPDLHHNSLRHLAVGAGDTVCAGMQYQGPKDRHPPLIALHRRGEPLRLLTPPAPVLEQMRNYCGSVCADASGNWFAVSSPRGSLVTFWSADGGEHLGQAQVEDGCGIAAGESPGEFLLSSGAGGLYRYRIADGTAAPLPQAGGGERLWDNHMTSLA